MVPRHELHFIAELTAVGAKGEIDATAVVIPVGYQQPEGIASAGLEVGGDLSSIPRPRVYCGAFPLDLVVDRRTTTREVA